MKITLTRGLEKFAPVQYHVIDIGPYSVEIEVPDDPNHPEFTRRIQAARIAMETAAKADFDQRLPEFLERIKKAAQYVNTGKRGER
jgi:hypothetical protein